MSDPIGTTISSTSPELLRLGATVNETRLVQSSSEKTVEFELQDTMEPRQVWMDVAHALGELQMWLLGPATPTASPSTPN
jgi:hypothetical protein